MSQDTERIKSKIDIVDFISEYIDLKPAGKNHKALCPFHNENTPSFMVNRERQMWHCFGCSRGGDIFTFLQEMEDMDFIESLKFLAERANVELSGDVANKTNQSLKNRLKDINQQAAAFFHNFLTQMDTAEQARNYLKSRGLKKETIDYWNIGYVPDQWELLTQYLLKQGYAIGDLVKAGLTKKRTDKKAVSSDRSYYDRFRGRIMFPIRDVHGSVVGFTGRILEETEYSGGKYINTPSTSIYDKSEIVFGLSKAKSEIREKDQIIMVEGQMDVIVCHQFGMENVVAVSGTSLTKKQVNLLQRYSDNLSIAFDNDEAGTKAARRGIRVALKEGMHVNVIEIPPEAGEDPDECLQNNPDIWFQAVEEARDIMEWYFKKALEGKQLEDPKQKQEVVNELLPEIASISYAVERDHWVQKLSDEIEVKPEVLREDMKRFRNQNEKLNSNNENGQEDQNGSENKTRFEKLLENFLGLIFRFSDIEIQNWPFEMSGKELKQDLFKLYRDVKQKGNLKELKSDYKREKKNLIDFLVMNSQRNFPNIKKEEAKKLLSDLSTELNKEWVRLKRKKLQRQIEKAEQNNNQEKLEQLLQQFNSLS